MQSKLVSLPTAISKWLPDGSSVVLGACLEANIPFAATHELIRQQRCDLHMIAPISDLSTDLLIGAGCVAEVSGAWVGNVSGGLGHNLRRAVEQGIPRTITVHDHSNYSLGLALLAGAYGLPYLPNRTLLGSDLLRSNPEFQEAENPFRAAEPIVRIPPLTPDVTILSVPRADEFGNAHHWGNSGVAQEAALASKRVLLLAEELVDTEVIHSDPSRVLVPGFRVTAVCHVPAGCHPSPMVGHWKRDSEFFNDYHRQSRTREGFAEWVQEWVLGVADHEQYCTKLRERLDTLRIRGQQLSAPANYAMD